MSVPPGDDLRAHVVSRTLALLREMDVPLYVILVGDVPEGASAHPERAPGLILDMTQAANGRRATPFAQSVADFFADDGLLLKKFVFRVEPGEGLKAIEPVVARISAPPSPIVETGLAAGLVLPLALFVFLLVGILVRSLPRARRRRDPGAADRPARARRRRPPPQAGAGRVGGSGPEPRGRSAGGHRHLHPEAARPRPERRGHRSLGGGRGDPGAPPAVARGAAPRAGGEDRRRQQGGEDLRPEPRLHGEEPRPRRGRARAHHARSPSAGTSPPSGSCAPRRTCSRTTPCGRSCWSRASTWSATAGRESARRSIPGATLHVGPYTFLVQDVAQGRTQGRAALPSLRQGPVADRDEELAARATAAGGPLPPRQPARRQLGSSREPTRPGASRGHNLALWPIPLAPSPWARAPTPSPCACTPTTAGGWSSGCARSPRRPTRWWCWRAGRRSSATTPTPRSSSTRRASSSGRSG